MGGRYRPEAQVVVNTHLASFLTWWELNRDRLNQGNLLEEPEYDAAIWESSKKIIEDLEDFGISFPTEQDGDIQTPLLVRGRSRVRGNRPR